LCEEEELKNMKNYIVLRCTLGIVGSIAAFIGGIAFIVAGIQESEAKGYLIGGACILASIVGMAICLVMFKKVNEKDK
jgi:hypothetical protein